MGRVSFVYRPAPLTDIYWVSWRDDEGVEHRLWVEARTFEEAQNLARGMSLGADVHVYPQSKAA